MFILVLSFYLYSHVLKHYMLLHIFVCAIRCNILRDSFYPLYAVVRCRRLEEASEQSLMFEVDRNRKLETQVNHLALATLNFIGTVVFVGSLSFSVNN